ncbi:hypothetical protein GW17_00037947 [Ensete ventricosum]|nr:hypothetical protein GW17_00037947 [Ensete ventricosum]
MLQSMSMLCEGALVATDPTYTSLGQNLELSPWLLLSFVASFTAAAAISRNWLRRGKKKQEKEGKPRTMPPSNGEAMARLSETSASKEPRDGATNENLVKR